MTVKWWVFPEWFLLKSSPFGNPQHSHIQGEEGTAEALGCTLPPPVGRLLHKNLCGSLPMVNF